MNAESQFEYTRLVEELAACGREAEVEASLLDTVYIDGGAFLAEDTLYSAESKMISFADRATGTSSTLRSLFDGESNADNVQGIDSIIDAVEDASDSLRSEAKAVGSYHPDDGPPGASDLQPAIDALNRFSEEVLEQVGALKSLPK